MLASLVPSWPSYRPVFDCLKYAKMEGEGLVYFITNDVGVYPGRQGGICTCVLCFEPEAAGFRFANIRNSST